MKDVQAQMETDRRIASKSTYSACICGVTHVPGCKCLVTERIIKVASLILVIGGIGWFWVH